MLNKKGNMISGIIGISIGAVVLATVFISQVKSANTSHARCYLGNGTYDACTWTASEIAMWGLLSLVGIVGLLYGVLNVFGIA